MSEISTLRQLLGEIAQGNLKLKVARNKMDEAVKGLQVLIDQLDDMNLLLAQVEVVDGLGGFQMGTDLAQKFTNKGSGDNSIRQRVNEVTQELKAGQDMIRKAATAYAETDAEYADVLQDVQP